MAVPCYQVLWRPPPPAARVPSGRRPLTPRGIKTEAGPPAGSRVTPYSTLLCAFAGRGPQHHTQHSRTKNRQLSRLSGSRCLPLHSHFFYASSVAQNGTVFSRMSGRALDQCCLLQGGHLMLLLYRCTFLPAEK